MVFRAGCQYRHSKCQDTDILVVEEISVNDEEQRISVFYIHRRLKGFCYPYAEKVRIKSKDLDSWELIEDPDQPNTGTV